MVLTLRNPTSVRRVMLFAIGVLQTTNMFSATVLSHTACCSSGVMAETVLSFSRVR